MNSLSDRQNIQEEQNKFPYHYLDLHSPFYGTILYYHYYSRIKAVKELMRPFDGQAILDAACGDGRFCYELKDENVKVVGVDYSPSAIAFARVFNPSAQFHVADLTDFHPNEKFEYITLIEALEHFKPEIIPRVISNLWEILKSDGRLIVVVPSARTPVPNKHYQHFTLDSLEKLFAPLFEPIKKIGRDRTGWPEKCWKHLRTLAIFVWWLQKRGRKCDMVINYVNRYYDKKVKSCSLEKAGRFIVVFKKNISGIENKTSIKGPNVS